MVEVATIKVHYGYCPKCAEPVKLRRMHTIKEEDHYWKIWGHFHCSENGEEGTPIKGAKDAFFKKFLIGEVERELRKGKKSRIQKMRDAGQTDLFLIPT